MIYFSPFKVENNNQFICLSEKNQYHSLRFVIPLEKSPESKGYLTNFSSIEPIKALLKQKAIFKDGENLYYRDPKAENEIKLVSDQVSEADITPNNNFIFYTKYDDHLYLYNTTSSSLVDLSERYSLQEAYRIYGIDDNWISFTATKDGLEYDVYAYSLAEDKLFNLSGSATKLYDDLSTGISGLIGSKIASPSFVWFNWEGGLRKLYYSNLDTIININDITHIPPDIFPAIIKPYIFKLSYADPKMAFTTQKVAWISKNPEQPYILYVAGLDGSYVSIINVPYIYSPPSGSGLYYVKQDGSLYLFKDGINDILIDRDLSLYISELASDSSGRIVAYTKGGKLVLLGW
ncbi:MAG: hypothetical protein KatS3mg068_0429 [Candidatus Sericytochromatia bacterium]|nr:MAG: hypothetical protein KatS3mg068_0429 [Candidatus Sericytochromatia bacterium]